jgi:hypothetical protein
VVKPTLDFRHSESSAKHYSVQSPQYTGKKNDTPNPSLQEMSVSKLEAMSVSGIFIYYLFQRKIIWF